LGAPADPELTEILKKSPREIIEEWPDDKPLPSKIKFHVFKLRKKKPEELELEDMELLSFYEMKIEETRKVTYIGGSGSKEGGVAHANIIGMGLVTTAWNKLQEQTLSTVEEQGEYIANLHKDRKELYQELSEAKKDNGVKDAKIKQLEDDLAKKESILNKLSEAGIALGGVAVAGGIPALFGKLGLNYSSQIGDAINKILKILADEKKG